MLRPALIALALTVPLTAQAQSKQEDCTYQGQVVKAIQEARLDRVKQEDVAAHIAAQNPTWPDQYNAAIPLMTPWVYEQKRRELKKTDVGQLWYQLCMSQ